MKPTDRRHRYPPTVVHDIHSTEPSALLRPGRNRSADSAQGGPHLPGVPVGVFDAFFQVCVRCGCGNLEGGGVKTPSADKPPR